MGAATVLLITDPADATADRVAAELTMQGVRFAGFDAADFPQRLHLAASHDGASWRGPITGTTSDGRQVEIDIADVRSVYYRRPTGFEIVEGMSGPEALHAYSEARRGFGGVLQSVGMWVNEPVAASQCEYKPRQLAAAADAGLAIPDTLITNDPVRARAWAGEHEQVVFKPMSGGWVPEDGQIKMLYTTVIDDPDTLMDPALELTAHLFQAWVPKAYEARAVVVGDQVFTTAIHAGSDAAFIDWRTDYDSLRYEPATPPENVRAGLVELHRRLGLVFGACDLVITPDGDWVFLEVNQSGEWGWLAEYAELPIAEALATVLERGAS